MDYEFIRSSIRGLQSSSTSDIIESLVNIKTKITISHDGVKAFRECSGLKHLIPLMQRVNERILDLTLSILGNCSLEEESNTWLGRMSDYQTLVSIIGSIPKDSIAGRTCRLIGNMCQLQSNADRFHVCGAPLAVVTFIDGRNRNISFPTLAMAVRAVRQLWMVTARREEMISLNSVRCVANLLIQQCEALGLLNAKIENNEGFSGSQEELVIGCLKCIGNFTTHATARCADQIQGDGRGYWCLVVLTKFYEPMALKCLMNLCYVMPCRPLLGNAGLVETLVEILKRNSDVSQWPDGAARTLAQLSAEAVNRSRLRYSEGLPLLIPAARSNHHALHCLLQYIFDNISFQILVNHGLLSLLIEELEKHVETMEFEHFDFSHEEKLPGEETTPSKKPDPPKSCRAEKALAAKARRERESRKRLMFKREGQLVIERDNMIVGFLDAAETDSTDDSEDDDDLPCRKYARTDLSSSPSRMHTKLTIMKKSTNKSNSVWDPKNPDWPIKNYPSSSSKNSDPSEQSTSTADGSSGSKRRVRDWSPVSVGSAASASWKDWSPGSSPLPKSPLTSNDESSDSEGSDEYSPVCTDYDEEEDELDMLRCGAIRELDTDEVVHSLDELIMKDNDGIDDEIPFDEEQIQIDSNNKNSRIGCVLVLFFRVAYGTCGSFAIRDNFVSNNTLELLCGQRCMNALLNYVEKTKRPFGRAARVLAKILGYAPCLINILRQRFISRLHAMYVEPRHDMASCPQCKQLQKLSSKLMIQLTNVAESSYGIGEITNRFLKGSIPMRKTLAITLPFVIKSEYVVKKYFFECSGLESLFSIIIETEETELMSITALSKVASSVRIKDPKSLENRFKEYLCVSYDPILDNLSSNDIITFELDDGSIVLASKLFLCQISEVFSAMLMGCFRESIEKKVKMQNVSKDALEHLFTILQCGLDPEIQVFPMSDDLNINLEVLLLADRFLLEKAKENLTSAILQFHLTPETADKVYIWALTDGMGFLCVETVAYVLTGQMSEADRTKCFKSILKLKYKDQWLDDIRNMIMRQLPGY